jgi:hypothetical protein
MSFMGKKMASSMVDELPPPDRLKRRPPGDEGEMADEEPDEGATMGTALADALKGGDGAAIYAAFKDMADHCSGGE